MSRTPRETDVPDHALTNADTPALPALAETANQMAAANTVILDSFDAIKAIGRIEMAEFFATVAEKVIAETFIAVKQTKQYKGLPYRKPNGEVATVATLEEFCEAYLHKSQRRCQELAANYHLLGPDLYEKAETIGLRQRDYNALKALPAADQEIVKQAIEAEDRSRVIDLMQEMAIKHGKEKEAAQTEIEAKDKQIADLKGDLDAKAKLIAAKNEKIDELATKLERKQDEPPLLTTIKYIDDLHHETMAIATRIQASLVARFTAVIEAHGDEGNAHARLLVAQSLGQIVSAARTVAAEFDVLPAEDAPSIFREAAGDDDREIWAKINADLAEQNAQAGTVN
jgi:hypothetical protein